MKLNWVAPRERFDHMHVSNVVEDGQALSLTCTYRCPQCEKGVLLTRENLERRSLRRDSNLPLPTARQFEEEAHLHAMQTEAFLDWSCPKCGLAARVYVRPWAGGRHGDSGVDIIALVEEEVTTR